MKKIIIIITFLLLFSVINSEISADSALYSHFPEDEQLILTAVTYKRTDGYTVIEAGIIGEDTTWLLENSPYLITGILEVRGVNHSSATLTIESGCELFFTPNSRLIITGTTSTSGFGTITNFGGIQAESVIFTINNPESGSTWQGISFENYALDYNPEEDSGCKLIDCTIEYANFDYAEDGNFAAINIDSSNPKIENCTISNNPENGIIIYNGAPKIEGCIIQNNLEQGIITFNGMPIISNNSFIDNGSYPLSFKNPNALNNNIPNNIFTNNGMNKIYVGSGTIATVRNNPIIWTDCGIPYFIAGDLEIKGSDFSYSSPFVIESGCELKFTPNSTLIITGYTHLTGFGWQTHFGSIQAENVIFTVNNPTSGSTWHGISFENYALDYDSEEDNGCKLIDCTIEYASFDYAEDGNFAAINIDSSNPKIDNCTIRDNPNNGIIIYNATPKIVNNRFINNSAYPVRFQDPANLNNNLLGNTYMDNGIEKVYINSGTIQTTRNSQITWGYCEIPYFIAGDLEIKGSDFSYALPLVIEPGCELNFATNSSFIITGYSRQTGFGWQTHFGSIQAKYVKFTSNDSSPESGWKGIFFENYSLDYNSGTGAGCYLLNCIIENCIDEINANYACVNLTTSRPKIKNCSFLNSDYGVYNNTTSSSYSFDARDNYWDSPLGPWNLVTNPSGPVKVSTNVYYNPWLSYFGQGETVVYPINVEIVVSNNSAQLSWDEVIEDFEHNPITPAIYIVYCNELSPNLENKYYFLAYTSEPNYTHVDIGNRNKFAFYKVKAYLSVEDEVRNQIDQLISRKQKVTPHEIEELIQSSKQKPLTLINLKK